jgi:hypothetical protein
VAVCRCLAAGVEAFAPLPALRQKDRKTCDGEGQESVRQVPVQGHVGPAENKTRNRKGRTNNFQKPGNCLQKDVLGEVSNDA